jgi:hypothetical protein
MAPRVICFSIVCCLTAGLKAQTPLQRSTAPDSLAFTMEVTTGER